MAALTVIFCGTGEKAVGPKDVANNILPHVNTKLRHNGGFGFENCRIYDGPGAASPRVKATRDNPTPFNIRGRKEVVCEGGRLVEKAAPPVYTVPGLQGGAGQQFAVKAAAGWIEDQLTRRRARGGGVVTDINLVGWSRGGVACVSLAGFFFLNLKRRLIRNSIAVPRVNMFCIDPVPGSSKARSELVNGRGLSLYVHREVHQCEWVLMENIGQNSQTNKFRKSLRSLETRALNAAGAGLTRTGTPQTGRCRTVYPMPGGHIQCVQFNQPDLPVGKIVANLLFEHLRRNHSDWKPMSDPRRAAAWEYIEWYARVRMGQRRKGRVWGHFFEKERASKYRARLVENAFRDDPFLVNAHHAALARTHLPILNRELQRHYPIPPGDLAAVRDRVTAIYYDLYNLGLPATGELFAAYQQWRGIRVPS